MNKILILSLILITASSSLGQTQGAKNKILDKARSSTGAERAQLLSGMTQEDIFHFLIGWEDYPEMPSAQFEALKNDPEKLQKESFKFIEAEDKKTLSLLSKEELFAWAEQARTRDELGVLARISNCATRKYEEYEEFYTPEEKAPLVALIIEGVEKDIKIRGGYAALANIVRLDHPLVDELIEHLKPIALTNRDCKSALQSLMIGLAARRAEKAARLAASNTAGPVPSPFSFPPPTDTTTTRTPVPIQPPRAATVRNPLWPWVAAACMALSFLIWRARRALRRVS